MKTIDQVERERNASYGSYHEDVNDYDIISECPEYVKCDCCGYYYDDEEIKKIEWVIYCPECREKYL